MYNLKLLSFAALLAASQAFAAQVSYSTVFTKGGADGHGGTESKKGVIPNNKTQDVVHDLGTWSNHRFEAKLSPAILQSVLVTSVKKVQTKDEAVKANNEAQSLIEKHIK